MNRLFLLGLAVLGHPRDRRQLRLAPARHDRGRPSRQRPGAARRASRSPRGRSRACGPARAARSRWCSACSASPRAARRCTTARAATASRAIPAAAPLLFGHRRRHAVALAPPRRVEVPAPPGARRRRPARLRLRRAPRRHGVRRQVHVARDVVPAPHLGAPHEDVTLTTSDGLDAQGLVRPLAQRRRGDRLPGAQGPAAARADAHPPRLRRAAARPPRRGRERGRPVDPGLGRSARPAGRRRLPPAPPGRRARPHRRARAVGRRRDDDRGRRVHAGAEGRRVRGRRHPLAARGARPRPAAEKWFAGPVHGHRDRGDRRLLQPRAAAQPRRPRRRRSRRARCCSCTPGTARAARSSSTRSSTAAPARAATLWEIPGAGHVGGIRAQPAEYERRVVGFFDAALR